MVIGQYYKSDQALIFIFWVVGETVKWQRKGFFLLNLLFFFQRKSSFLWRWSSLIWTKTTKIKINSSLFSPKWCLQKSILFRVSHKYVIILGKHCQFSNYCRTHFFWKLWSSERDHTQTMTTGKEGGRGKGKVAKFQLGGHTKTT